jgi:O-antigen ligase
VAAIALVAQPIAAGGASRPELPAGAPPPSPRPGRRGARPGVALWLALLGLATLGFNKTRLAGWAVSDLIFLLGAVVTALKMLSGKTADLAPATMRKTSPPVLVGTIVLGCAGTLSCFQSFTPFDSAEMVVRIVWITLVWFWFLRAVCPNRSTLNRMFKAFELTVIISCTGAILGYFGIVHLTADNPDNRQAAFFGHPNELGGMLAVAVPFVVLGIPWRKSATRLPWRRIATFVLIVFALGTTGSMTAFVATAVALTSALGLTLLTRGPRPAGSRIPSPIPVLLGLAVAVGGIFWLFSSDLPVIERFTQLEGGGSSVSESVSSRENLNDYVIDNLDNSLVVGVGLDANTTFVGDEEGAEGASRIHNLYLKLLYETGLPGLVGLLIVLVTSIRQAWRLVVNTRGTELHPVAVAILSSILAINVFAMFQPIFAQRFYWLPLAFVSVLWALRREELRERNGDRLEPVAAPLV